MRWLKRLIAPGLGMFLLWLLSFGGLHDIVANESMDLLFRLRGPVKPDQRIVIVGVDEPSLSALGRWPFPRRFHGELLSHLHGARAISFDFFFPEASADDRSLSVAMQAAPPVLLPVAFVDNDEALLPTPSLSGYAGLGHIETLLSGDGIVRRVSLAQKKGIPAFSKTSVTLLITPHSANDLSVTTNAFLNPLFFISGANSSLAPFPKYDVSFNINLTDILFSSFVFLHFFIFRWYFKQIIIYIV